MGKLSPVTDLSALCLFLGGAVTMGIATWSWVCAAGLDRRGLAESTLGWGMLALAWIAGAGVLLGATGGLGRMGFFWLHASGLLLTVIWRRRYFPDDCRRWQAWLAGWRGLIGGGTTEGRITAGLLLLLLILAMLAAQAEPVVFDALTYRLSRVGQWLQDGRVAHYATDDPRLNYMPVVADLVVAWLLGATNAGFRLAPLSQLAGGGLLLGATFGLARLAGLGRWPALGAVAVLLGMANVAVQFTTIQNDLLVAGIFSASYFLWHRALLRSEGSWVAGIGVGLAAGAKGTLFYLAPGAVLWTGWLIWQQRRNWRALVPTAGGALLAGLLFFAPVCWRNLATYGEPFGPHEAMVLHHGEPLTPQQRLHKLGINLGTSAVQLLDPNSQPYWCQEWCRAAGRSLLPFLPDKEDRDVFAHYPRRDQVELIMSLHEPDADLVSCGVLAVVLFVGGLVVAAVRRNRDRGAAQVLIWAAGVVIYVLTQHAIVQWHQWAFRFMVLAAPWLAVVGAWGLGQLGRRMQIIVWTVVIGSAVQVFAGVQAQANQAAWQAITRPDRAFSHFLYGQWREWTGGLAPASAPLNVALPNNEPLAAFYRQPAERFVQLARVPDESFRTAEQYLRGKPGWVVVPAARFMGHEGRVRGRAYRYFGQDGSSPYSLAAYRNLRPGEEPASMLYRSLHTAGKNCSTWDLLVRSWRETVSLRLHAPNDGAWSFVIMMEGSRQIGRLAADETCAVSLRVPVDRVAKVRIDFEAANTPSDAVAVPTVELVSDGEP